MNMIEVLLFVHSIWPSIIWLTIQSNLLSCIKFNNSFLFFFFCSIYKIHWSHGVFYKHILFHKSKDIGIDWQVFVYNYLIEEKNRKINCSCLLLLFLFFFSDQEATCDTISCCFHQGFIDTHLFNINEHAIPFANNLSDLEWWGWWWCSFVRWLSACLFPPAEI